MSLNHMKFTFTDNDELPLWTGCQDSPAAFYTTWQVTGGPIAQIQVQVQVQLFTGAYIRVPCCHV